MKRVSKNSSAYGSHEVLEIRKLAQLDGNQVTYYTALTDLLIHTFIFLNLMGAGEEGCNHQTS